jgi:hypothetical protein
MTNFQEQLEEIKQACRFHGWDGEVALPLNERSVRLAEEFVKQAMELYPELPYPELAPEPDGCLGFEWNTKRGQFAISIDENHKLFYACRLDTLAGRGSFEYKGTVPPVLWNYFKALLLELEKHDD